MGMIVDVPGHRTDALLAQPTSEKVRKLGILLNKSKVPFNLRGTRIQPGKQGAIADWQFLQGDTVVRQWLAAGALEVVEERDMVTEAPPAEPPPPEGTAENFPAHQPST